MPVFNLTGLVAVLPPGAPRLLGVDYGSKRIGLALSDVGRGIASPYGTLARRKLAANAAEIAVICTREGAGGLVLGLPLSADGSLNPAAQRVRDWGRDLSERTGLPLAFWDERDSTVTVLERMIDADLSRSKRAERVDRAAAAFILQGALDGANIAIS